MTIDLKKFILLLNQIEQHFPALFLFTMKMKNAVSTILLALIFHQAFSVTIEEGNYEGRPQFIIKTKTATYFYDKAGGGFSRMIDKEGKDWISFKKNPLSEYPVSAGAGFRGLPNMVFGNEDGGAGHPGHDKCVSEILNEHTIITKSKSGKWEWIWEFEEKFARLTVKKTDPNHPYWFLYEGTIGGKFSPTYHYWGTDKGGPNNEIYDFYKGKKLFEKWNWIYFGDKQIDRVLFLLHQTPDNKEDVLGYLGNSDKGIDSEDGMVVFGFGRAKGTKPQMTAENNSFIIGFLEKRIEDGQGHDKAKKKIEKLKK